MKIEAPLLLLYGQGKLVFRERNLYLAETALVHGETVMENRRLTRVDEERVYREIQRRLPDQA